jgi:hypothetical protein
VFFSFGSKGISFVHNKAIYTWKERYKYIIRYEKIYRVMFNS